MISSWTVAVGLALLSLPYTGPLILRVVRRDAP